jgi:hypothetical protein
VSRRAGRAVIATTFALAIGGCAAAPAAPPAPPSATQPEEPAPTSTATPDPGAGVIDTTTWVEWVSSDGFASLRHPADWEAVSESSDPPEAFREVNPVLDSVELTAPNGQMLVGLWDYVDVGGVCDAESVRPIEVLAMEESELPFDRDAAQAGIDEWSPGTDVDSKRPVLATYALGTTDGRWNVGVGLTTPERFEHGPTCYVYNIASSFAAGTSFEVTTEPDALWTVDSLDDARAYMESAEYGTILEILRSVEVAS